MKRLIISAVVLLGSCSPAAESQVPPEIAFGRDVCVQCGMIITDARFAAAYRVEGEARLFDDIGDMVVYGLDTGELAADTPAWVHDYVSGAWIDADSAWFVSTDQLMTPMDHGLGAFESRDDAVTFAGFLGHILTWDNLLAATVDDGTLDFDRH